MNLAELRAVVRRELHDEEAAAYRWSNAELDRHLQHAVNDLSLFVPLEATAVLTTTASRDLSVSGVTGLVRIEAVEYPVDQYPPVFAPFSHWGQMLTLLVEKTPASGESARLYYVKGHSLTASSSTVPPHLEETVALGAAAFAALEWAAFAATLRLGSGQARSEHGAEAAARQYLAWGKGQLATFQRALNRLSAKNSVRARQLYVAAAGKASQSKVAGP